MMLDPTEAKNLSQGRRQVSVLTWLVLDADTSILEVLRGRPKLLDILAPVSKEAAKQSI
jgi:hypothetical protein